MSADDRRRRAGILGGSFDPIHLGHTGIATAARRALALDLVTFLPNRSPPHKGVSAAAEHRLAMVRIAVEGIEGFDVSDIEIRREAGKLDRLHDLLDENPVLGSTGIGHTRWATHGEPSARNAHPHIGSSGRAVIVHNGIVENAAELKEELIAEGVEFLSDTDTEVIVHLVEGYLASGEDLPEAARKAIIDLEGAHGIVVMSADDPKQLVAARVGNAGGDTSHVI